MESARQRKGSRIRSLFSVSLEAGRGSRHDMALPEHPDPERGLECSASQVPSFAISEGKGSKESSGQHRPALHRPALTDTDVVFKHIVKLGC